MTRIILIAAVTLCLMVANARTLIAYYSYTNNVERIVNELKTQIVADVAEIEPTEKGLDYAANNYAIGSAQIAAIRENPDDAASYPAIDPLDVNVADYDCIIIAAPLWWSNMGAPMQTFLFQHGKEIAGKNIGLIVSSASSGISGVEADAKRLIPDGVFLSPSLWIRSSQTSNAASMLQAWLNDINYNNLSAGIADVTGDSRPSYTVYSLSGTRLIAEEESTETLSSGIYIVNGQKRVVKH